MYSAQAAFSFIISVVPFFMLLLALVRYILPHFYPISDEAMRAMVEAALPNSLQYYLLGLLDEIYSGSSIQLVSTTAIFALWASSRGVQALMQGLNEINGMEESRSFLEQKAIAILNTVLMLLLLAASLIVLVFENEIMALILRLIPRELDTTVELLHLKTLPAILVIVALFMFFYWRLPARKLRLLMQFPGAVFSASLWILFSYLYSIYVDRVAKKSIIYGSLGAVVFLMLWLYWCLEIFLIGAEVNKYFAIQIKAKSNQTE